MSSQSAPTATAGLSRQETDSMGAITVPADHYWGAQTQRSIGNFPFGQRMPLAIVHAFGQLKAACAEANRDLGKLDDGLCAAIVAAADEVAAGGLDQEFPLK
ncbi:MAG: lyase family protein, partial [Vulcanococcus sp.]